MVHVIRSEYPRECLGAWSKDLYLTGSFLHLHLPGGSLKPCLPKVLWRCYRHWYLTPTMMCPMSGSDIMTLQTQRPMRLELTHSPILCEFNNNNQGLSLLEWRIEAMFSFLCRSSTQVRLSDHTPCFPSFWVHLAHNEWTEGFLLTFWFFTRHRLGFDSSEKN